MILLSGATVSLAPGFERWRSVANVPLGTPISLLITDISPLQKWWLGTLASVAAGVGDGETAAPPCAKCAKHLDLTIPQGHFVDVAACGAQRQARHKLDPPTYPVPTKAHMGAGVGGRQGLGGPKRILSSRSGHNEHRLRALGAFVEALTCLTDARRDGCDG